MRLINADDTREELIATLRDCFNVTYELVDVVATTINNMPTIQPEPHWIPCEERLPDKEKKTYWVCLDGGGQCQCRWTNDMYGLGVNEWSKWGWHVMDKPQYSEIVAWMPLPKVFKENEHESN